MAKKKNKRGGNTIALNKKARHDYFIEQTFEAGISLEGWEVKSMRDGRVQLKEGYVIVRNGELFLFGVHLSPLASTSTHITPDPTRTRRLLLHRREINTLIGAVDRRGYTLVPLALYWSKEKQHDKRATIKQREWDREQHRVLKENR